MKRFGSHILGRAIKNIKSELSTCLGDDLLAWLMLFTLEGSALKDKEAVRALCLCAMRSWLQLKQRVPSHGNPGATRKRKKADSGDGQTLIEELASTNEMPFGSAAAAAQGAQQMSPKPAFAAIPLAKKVLKVPGTDPSHECCS
jgi:hypothetical protein